MKRHIEIGVEALRLIRGHGKSVRHLQFEDGAGGDELLAVTLVIEQPTNPAYRGQSMVDATIVDGLFVELLTVSKAYLTEAERQEVQQLLDQAEYPAALETFVYIFVDGGKSATQEVFSLITRLTGMLHMQLDDTITKIPRLPPGR